MRELETILTTLAQRPGISAAMATLVGVVGSSYRRPGSRLLLMADGTHSGSISAGCLEEDVLERLRETLATGQPQLAEYETGTDADQLWGVGVGCKGAVRVVIEKLPPHPGWIGPVEDAIRVGKPVALAVIHGPVTSGPWGTCLAESLPELPAGMEVFHHEIPPPEGLLVFGAGESARPLVQIARQLGFRVTLVDARPALATPARFPEADAVVVARPEEVAGRVPLAANSVAVVMTHRYAEDLRLLRVLLPQPFAYLGMLGSRDRTEGLLAELVRDGFEVTLAMRDRLHAPVGLDIGATTHEAVAIAILAEALAVLAGRDPRPLRERAGPIHERR